MELIAVSKEEVKMKTQQELNALKEEFEALHKKLAELSEEELEQVSGGIAKGRRYWNKDIDVAEFLG